MEDKARENIAVQMQARRIFKGKDGKEQVTLIVPCSPCTCHHPLGRHEQLHVYVKTHREQPAAVKIHAALDVSPGSCCPRELKDVSCLTRQRSAYFHMEIRSPPIHKGKSLTELVSKASQLYWKRLCEGIQQEVFIRGNFKSLMWKRR